MAKLIKGKTETGFEFEISKENLDNYELLEYFGEVDENPTVVPKIVRLLLGKEQSNKLKDHARSGNGIVSTEAMSKELEYIFSSVSEIKNS